VRGGAAMLSYANCGPTHEPGQQPVFCWSETSDAPHHGHPACFDFQTVQMQPHAF
jgi:hypothetical protein